MSFAKLLNFHFERVSMAPTCFVNIFHFSFNMNTGSSGWKKLDLGYQISETFTGERSEWLKKIILANLLNFHNWQVGMA